MIFIAHRGNTEGPDPDNENTCPHIDRALHMGFECELDVWVDGAGKVLLGHEFPENEVSLHWLEERSDKLWIHCKNVEALAFFLDANVNCFWHESDQYTITSRGWIWTYPGYPPRGGKAVCVLPESNALPTIGFSAICSDYISRYDPPHSL